MDRVGLGRALGFGARQAARTLVKIADAATTPSPAAPTAASASPVPPPLAVPVNAPAAQVSTPKQQPGRPAKGLGGAVLKPVAKFTSVLWLEVTGLFYAVFAAILGMAAYRQWQIASVAGVSGDHKRFFLYIGVAAVFAYFSFTNFFRARRRGRQ